MHFKKFFSKIHYMQLIGIALFLIGVVFFCLSVDATKKIADANTLSQNFSNFFKHNPTWNPILKFFGGEAQKKIDYYSTQVLIIQIGSVVLTAIGAVMTIIYRNKKSKRKR